MTIKGILFDKDGTLVDNAGPWIYDLSRLILDFADGNTKTHDTICLDIGLDITQHRAIPFSTLAQGTFEETAQIIHQHAPNLSIDQIFNRMADTASRAQRHVAPLEGTLATIPALHAQGYIQGIFSNDSEYGIDHAVDDMQLALYFTFIAGADSGYGSKPSATFIEAFCAQHDLMPDEIAIIGDSPADMISADLANVRLKIGIHENLNDATLRYYTPYIMPNLLPLPEFLAKL